MNDKDNKYFELYEENNQLQEELTELQDQLEDMGFLGDNISEESFDLGSQSKTKNKGKKLLGALKKRLSRTKKGKKGD